MSVKRLPPKPANKDRPLRHQSPGAPALDINLDEIRRLARLGASTRTIAELFQCDPQSIHNRVTSAELNALRQERPNKLREAVFLRAMGGKYEEKQPDGTVIVKFLKGSERMMELAMKYLIGAPPQVIEINPDQERPSHVHHTVDPDAIKAALAKFDSDY